MPSAPPPVRCLQALLLGLLLVTPFQARAQDVVGKVTQLNKKALEAYDNLEFDEAKRYLNQALEQCQTPALENHVMRARSYVHLGVVLIAGFKQKDEGSKMFCEALRIAPDIKLTKSLANPELQEAFDSASASCGKGPVTTPSGLGGGALAISHEPVRRSPRAAAIPISAVVSGEASFEKVVLFYRRQGATEFSEKEMVRGEGSRFKAEIPATETRGTSVVYYIAAQSSTGLPVTSKGSAFEPMTIAIGAGDVGKGAAGAGAHGKSGSGAAADATGARFVIGLGVGTGMGYVSGVSPEVNSPLTLSNGDGKVSGLHMASLLHIVPEIGYMLSPSLMLSLQGRFQIITGGVQVADPNGSAGCPKGQAAGYDGEVGLCDTAKYAPSVVAKLTYYFSQPGAALRTFAGVAAGGGYVRNSVTLAKPTYGDCFSGGASVECKDTVRIGPVLAGPLVGLMYNATKTFGLALSLQILAGFPDFGVQVDVNGGMILRL